MRWGPQVQVPPQMSAAACPGLSPVLGTRDPGNRPWRYQQDGGGEGPGFGNWNTVGSVLGWRSVSLTRGQ